MFRFFLCLLSLLVSGGPLKAVAGSVQQKDAKNQVQSEELRDYFAKWLREDVVYIISPAEREVFEALSTGDEKEQFIEQFWYRRDIDPLTSSNEFKEEHYRRLAYVNERFNSGIPGWKTDRGIIYIIHGEPAEIESHKSGQSYNRPASEGGGLTNTIAFELWRYRRIEGIGLDVEIEFVDPSGSGEFRLSRSPWEKDAWLFSGQTGLTMAESIGLAQRGDHPYFSPSSADTYPGMHRRYKDQPFQRYEQLVKVQRVPPVKYPDLKQLIEIDVRYNLLPFKVRPDYFRLNDQRMLVPVTLQIENKHLSFASENGLQVARVGIYGIVASLTNRIVAEFEDDLIVSFREGEIGSGLRGRSIYQKVLLLDSSSRYRLDVVLKDMNSGKLGVLRQGLILPKVSEQQLATSSLVLSNHVQELEQIPTGSEMFVIGDIKVRPELDDSFSRAEPVWAYLQLYNAGLDQTSLEPSLSVTYRVLKDGRKVSMFMDQNGESTRFYSGQRIVLLQKMPLMNLKPAEYELEIEISDHITGRTVTARGRFELTSDQ